MNAEAQAIRTDARARLNELIAVREELLPNADDAAVLSELTAVESQITAAKKALWPNQY